MTSNERFAEAVVDAIQAATQPLHEPEDTRGLKTRCAVVSRRGYGRRRREAIDRVVTPLIARVSALEPAKAAAPACRWLGVWRSATTYSPGDMVTHKGGLWLCIRESGANPQAMAIRDTR